MTHRLTWVTSWLSAFGFAAAPVSEAPRTELPLQRLRKILVVVAKLTGARHTEQLLVDRMNLDSMLFITRADLGEGDQVEVQLLVPGFGQVSFSGTVVWLRPSSKGRLEGELTFAASPNQRQILADYLARDARGQR